MVRLKGAGHRGKIGAVLLKDNANNCRVTRHLPTTTSHEHGSPAETKPDRTIYAHGIKVANILLDPKLY